MPKNSVEIFILKMPVLKLADLADAIKEEFNSTAKTKIIGPRPGEKRHEMLMTDDEAANALETKDLFITLRKDTL